MAPSFWQILIILLIVILLFGTKRLGGLGSDLGKMIKGFKSSMSEEEEEASKAKPDTKKVEADAAAKDAHSTESVSEQDKTK